MYVTSKLFQSLGVVHGFTTRLGGLSLPPFATLNLGLAVGDDPAAVESNLTLLAARIGCQPDQIVFAKQRHTDTIITVNKKNDIQIARTTIADALICALPGCVVAVRTADCLPVLVIDSANRIAAAVHMGWRGCVKRILEKTVDALLERGSSATDLAVAIGPCISSAELRLAGTAKTTLEKAKLAKSSLSYKSTDRTAIYLDLKKAAFNQAVGRGVAKNKVEILDGCTFLSSRAFLFLSSRWKGLRSTLELCGMA